MVGVAFLMCCLEVEHGQTVNERSGGPYDRWQSTTDIQGLLFEDVAEGFGPLQSAYNAKDIGVLISYGNSEDMATFIYNTQFGLSTLNSKPHGIASFSI